MSVHPLWSPFSPRANETRQGERVGVRQTQPGGLQAFSPRWAADAGTALDLIRAAIPDQVIALRHVGSTSVPGLLAKPVIDIDLTVPDVEDETAYLDRLEDVGFRLVFRDDIAGDLHRQLTLADPNTNLHVWSAGAIEPQRHALFADRLRTSSDERDLYARVKAEAADGAEPGRYNDRKAPVVYDIYERAFAADPLHPHDPRPRPHGDAHPSTAACAVEGGGET